VFCANDGPRRGAMNAERLCLRIERRVALGDKSQGDLLNVELQFLAVAVFTPSARTISRRSVKLGRLHNDRGLLIWRLIITRPQSLL